MKRIVVLIIVVLIVITTGVIGAKYGYDCYTSSQNSVNKVDKSNIKEVSKITIESIKNKDFNTISNFVHKDYGIRFSPYYDDVDSNLIFDKANIKTFLNDTNIYIWGKYDGIGDDISLTTSEYYNKFIYDYDFSMAQIGENKIISFGNQSDYHSKLYSNTYIVEFAYDGTEDCANNNWKSLRLIFQLIDNQWYLVCIVHCQDMV